MSKPGYAATSISDTRKAGGLSEHVEPDSTDIERMSRRLFQAVTALIPMLLEEK